DQVGQQLDDPFGVALGGGQGALDADDRPRATVDELLQVGEDRRQEDVPVQRPGRADDAPGPAEGQQVVDESAESAAGLGQVGDVLAALAGQLRAVVGGEEVAERLQCPQRLLEV